MFAAFFSWQLSLPSLPSAWRKGGRRKATHIPYRWHWPYYAGLRRDEGRKGGEGGYKVHPSVRGYSLDIQTISPPLSLSRMQQSFRPRVMPDRVNITCLRSLLYTGVLCPAICLGPSVLLIWWLYRPIFYAWHLDYGFVLYSKYCTFYAPQYKD